jgi:hypothetical protein
MYKEMGSGNCVFCEDDETRQDFNVAHLDFGSFASNIVRRNLPPSGISVGTTF